MSVWRITILPQRNGWASSGLTLLANSCCGRQKTAWKKRPLQSSLGFLKKLSRICWGGSLWASFRLSLPPVVPVVIVLTKGSAEGRWGWDEFCPNRTTTTSHREYSARYGCDCRRWLGQDPGFSRALYSSAQSWLHH